MNQRRCLVLIDGSNFYFKLKNLELHNLLEFNFSGFAKALAGKNKIIRSTYHIGAVRADGTKKANKMHADQQKLFFHLKKHGFQYSLGYLLKTDGKYREKGVDVNVAGDIYVATYENLCDHFILVSSDTDLLPAVRKAKEKGKTIEYVGFSHQPSLAMIANCTESRLLKKEDLLPFVQVSR
ncbi:MAG: NYN domain-containing protein [Patescibacteria group bacterium]